MKIQVFDPPMCCSTGICGPAVDPDRVRIATDLDWLSRQGVEVERINILQVSATTAGMPLVTEVLQQEGNGCLPIVLVDGVLVCKGRYPTREELAAFAGLVSSPSIFTDAVRELVAIGAAIASNCEPCFRHHFNEARKLGVSKEDMRLAVDMAQAVKASPARSVIELADKYLSESRPESGSCCSTSADENSGRSCCG